MTGLQHFDKEQKSNPQSHVSSPFHNSLGIISGSTRRKMGIISGLGIISGSGSFRGLYRRFSKNTSLSLQQVFTLASVTSRVTIGEILKDTTTADSHKKVAWKSEFTFFLVSIAIIPTRLLSQCKRTLLELNFYQQ